MSNRKPIGEQTEAEFLHTISTPVSVAFGSARLLKRAIAERIFSQIEKYSEVILDTIELVVSNVKTRKQSKKTKGAA